MKDIIIVLLSCGVGVEIIRNVYDYIKSRRERKDKKEDKAAEEEKESIELMKKQIAALVESQRYVMYDRIKFLAQSYIREKSVDFDDRRMLHLMHDSYHNGLDGNGDLDLLMEEVDELPLKE